MPRTGGKRRLDERDADGQPSHIGGFKFYFVGQRWEWSDEVARMHGYEPGSVQPTTELLLSHKHPEDRRLVQDLLDHALHTGDPFSSRHRFIDTRGELHDVLVVADRMFDDRGAVIGSSGYYVDLTASLDEARQEVLDEQLPGLFESRAVIEQAKGALMVIYRISADQAFRVLQWRSQETNKKLRSLAAQLIAEIGELPAAPSSIQSQFDHLLLTIHARIPGE
ncbi:PAS and ANTAR domain-containing protein [Mycolicibacterium litorale]|uniref:PAS and ANTAR domain-containing protein n=1 Tax=Mycolicibacterium litorale TaxID=758802 RepID=UPI003CED58AC